MGKKEQRIKESLQLIQRQNGISLSDLAKLLDVSEITARRDVEELESRNLVQNIRGTVFFNTDIEVDDEYLLSIAATRHRAEKKRIGAYAASLIENGEYVIIDNGSTTEQLAASIPVNKNATVLCYNVNVLNNLYLKRGISLIFCGGVFHHQSLMFESPEGLEMIRKATPSKVFVSAAGINEDLGVTCASDYEVACKRVLMDSAGEKILLADSSKFGATEPCFVGKLDEFDMIISDSGLSEEWREIIKNKRIRLVVV